MGKHKVDKDLKRISAIGSTVMTRNKGLVNLGFAGLFMALVFVFMAASQGMSGPGLFVVVAGVIGAYMAINIGANDVANNIGPAVGSKALTMAGALIIAAIFEAAGALLAGGDVVSTISKGIIDPSRIPTTDMFLWAMLSALLAAALWLNLATWVGAPVSTTHSIVGGVVGAGVAAAGVSAVDWWTLGGIAASWVISPVLGGAVAAGFLYFVKRKVLFQEDRLAAARRWVPLLVALMAAAFVGYMGIKGLKRIWQPDGGMVIAIALASSLVVYLVSRPLVKRASAKLGNSTKDVAKLFTVPLIIAAAFLSFAHGANDVANAVGPLAAIVSASTGDGVHAEVEIPIWVMIVGALGISVGLMLFGPKLIRTVGSEITKLNQIRAFCVALSAAITVIIASYMGLPVSSTHIAVGGVFGVGFLREYLANRPRPANAGSGVAAAPAEVSEKKLKKKAKKAAKRKLVRRRHMLTIIAAWVITVPLAAMLSGLLFTVLYSVFSDVGLTG